MNARAEPSPTASFVLGPKGARSAVLLLHGFTGSPWELRSLGEALAARGAHVSCPRLPGHGAEPEAMLWVTWRSWVDAAERALLELSRFEHVSVAGLSMGALLSIIMAARHPQRVARLVLMAPALQLADPASRALRLVRHRPLSLVRDRWVVKKGTDLDDEEARAQSPLLPRYPVSRVLDLFTLQDVARLSAPVVTCPTLVLGAVNDHVVAPKGVEWVHRHIAHSELRWLQRGFHILPRDKDRARVATEIAEFLDRDLTLH